MKRCGKCGGIILTAAVKEKENGVKVFYHWGCWANLDNLPEPDNYDPRLPYEGKEK